jgi:lactate dehydrogenase-like 2-hydroxyacid dehydrogenase
MTASDARPGILLGYRLNPTLVSELGKRGDVLGPMERSHASAVPAGAGESTRILVTVGSYPADGALMDALPQLGLIACLGSGYERIDIEAARSRGVRVTHSPGGNAGCVADLTMGLLIASARRIAFGDRYIRAGKWTSRGQGRYGRIAGLGGGRLGILGLGAIGIEVARRAEAFGMEIGYHNRRRRDDVAYPYFDSAMALAAWCDYLVVALRSDASNRHIVNAELLRALGPRGHVINISRGLAVDEAALAQALADGTIEGAALDVFEEEPKMHPAFAGLENVVLTPHLGGGTEISMARMSAMVLSNVDAFLAGRTLVTPVPELAAP